MSWSATTAVQNDPAAKFELARLLAATGRHDRALQIVEAMMSSAATPEAFRLAGNWRLELKQAETARAIFARGLKIAPLNLDLINGYICATMHAGGPAGDLLPMARKAVELSNGDPRIADTLGWVLAESSHTEEAVHVMREVLRKLPDDPTAGYHYALACARDGQAEEAGKKLGELIAEGKPFADLDAARALLKKISGQK